MMSHETQSAPPGVMLYFRWSRPLLLLTDLQRGRILSAMLTYGTGGHLPDFSDDPMADFAWQTIQPQIDEDRKRYQRIVEKRREAANRRWNPESAAAPAQRQPQPSAAPYRSTTQPRRTPGMPGSVLDPNVEKMNRYL